MLQSITKCTPYILSLQLTSTENLLCGKITALCRSLLIIHMNESKGYLKNLFRTLLKIFIPTLLGWVARGLFQNTTKIKLDCSRNPTDFHIL